MDEQQPDRPWYRSCIFKLILMVALTIMLVYGGLFVFIYFIGGGYEYDRAVNVAELALGDVWQLSEQVLEAAPEGATLTGHQQPRSGVRRPALSDGSPQHASASARQDYIIQLGLNAILAHYDQLFTSWGWNQIPPNFYTGRQLLEDGLQRIYRHPDNEYLLVELCQLKPTASPEMTEYHIFFEFDEIPAMIVFSDGTYKNTHNRCEN